MANIVTNQEIIDAYKRTGSVWRAGKELGMPGQSIHSRLKALGYPLPGQKWTPEEEEELRRLVAGGCTLGEIASRLGRPYNGVALKASRLELPARVRPQQFKVPRGAGWDKKTTLKHMKALEGATAKFTVYCRANSVDPESMAKAIQRIDLNWWNLYVESHSDLPQTKCGYCGRTFVPSTRKQKFCERKCASHSRTDERYFAGNRRNTLGLLEGICQLCGRKDAKGLASHHMVGKERDPSGELLIALCPGCHGIVGSLAARSFVDQATGWENLINLVMLRRLGTEKGGAITTYVEIEWEPCDEGSGEDLIAVEALGEPVTAERSE